MPSTPPTVPVKEDIIASTEAEMSRSVPAATPGIDALHNSLSSQKRCGEENDQIESESALVSAFLSPATTSATTATNSSNSNNSSSGCSSDNRNTDTMKIHTHRRGYSHGGTAAFAAERVNRMFLRRKEEKALLQPLKKYKANAANPFSAMEYLNKKSANRR